MSIIVESDGIRTGPAHLVGVNSRDIAAFYQAEWPRPIALCLPRFYKWQFVEPPDNEGRDWNVVSVRNGEILGVMGLNRRRFILEGEILNAAELTTWVVSAKTRGRGVGRSIMQSLKATYDYMTGFGISQAAMPIYTTEGFRHLAHIPRYLRLFDIEAIRSLAVIDRLGERLAGQWDGIAFPKYITQRCAAADLDGVAQYAVRDANMYLRNKAALAWRYDNHPVYDYQAYLVKAQEGGGSGIGLILRLDEVEGIRFLHVVDIFGDRADLAAAIGFIDDVARKAGCVFADAYHCRSAVGAEFLAHGWFSTIDDTFIQLPHLFYPIELRSPATTSAVLWARRAAERALDFGRLHLCKGDLDLDRPTISYYQTWGLELV